MTTQLAIGCVGFAYLDDKVRPLRINGVYPSEVTVLKGSYPIGFSGSA
ncbi:MAG: hypothetical protein ACW97Z_16125 [Candidatus Hodarchaeales archaeon]